MVIDCPLEQRDMDISDALPPSWRFLELFRFGAVPHVDYTKLLIDLGSLTLHTEQEQANLTAKLLSAK